MNRRLAVAPVVGTLMMVAVTVALAAVLFVVVGPMISPPPPPPVAITFDSLGWNASENTALISTATGAGAIPVSGLQYSLRDSADTSYYAGRANTPQTTNSVIVNVRYQDADSDDRITAGDRIIIEVLPPAAAPLLDGGVFAMYYSGQQIASHGVS